MKRLLMLAAIGIATGCGVQAPADCKHGFGRWNPSKENPLLYQTSNCTNCGWTVRRNIERN